jgi:Mrp family chromosome partitioning ATPase
LIEENDAEESACKCSSENDSYVVDENQSLIVNDVEETLYKAKEILELLNHKFNEDGSLFKRPFDVPENPKFTVGLDILFSKLKMELLRGGSSTLVLTGLGGLGKTTLATMLCWDEQVNGKS